MIEYLVCCFVGSFIGMIVMALISAGKYDDQQRYFAKERQKWEEENQKLKRKIANYEWQQRQTELIAYQLGRERENITRREVRKKVKANHERNITVGGKTLEDIKSVTFEEAIKIMKKGDAKAIVAHKEGLKIIDLPDHGVAGLRMVAGRLDRVEYSYTKK
ncbi:MAG: DUF3789 domain-containing protein [Enterococcus sp.]